MTTRVINIFAVGFFFLIFGLCAPAMGAEMEWQIEKKIELKSPAIDMAVSIDRQHAFLLDDKGNLSIYKLDGSLEGSIPVGKGFDHIEPGPSPEIIFLSNRKTKSVDLLTLDFIQEINTKGAPFKGPENAPVVISLFTDFQCPYCAQVGPQLEEVLKEFPKEVKLVYKSFPLRMHRYAMDAAKAAMAADKMGKFWEFHDLLFKNYNKLNKEKIDEIREQLKLDKEEFEKYAKSPEIEKAVTDDFQNGVDAGVRGTPSLFLNGKPVKDRSSEGLKKSIKAELKKVQSKK